MIYLCIAQSSCDLLPSAIGKINSRWTPLRNIGLHGTQWKMHASRFSLKTVSTNKSDLF